MSRLSLSQKLALEINKIRIDEEQELHPLSQLFWECTLRCNLNCRHCGSDCKTISEVKDMPFADFEKVLLEIKSKGWDSHKIRIIFTGGEPLLRSDLAECGRRVYDLEFPWGIVSNGRCLDRRRLDTLLAAGLHAATISLDGFEDDHDWMRGQKGSFKYADAAVRMLVREPEVAFDVVTCVNRRNYARLNEFKEYLISIGLKQWRLFTVFPVGRAAQGPNLRLTAEQFRGLMDFIRETRQEGRIMASYACEGFLGEYEGRVRGHLFSCQAGLSVASIRSDGDIASCLSVRSKFSQGNIYRDSFTEVWETRFSQMRDRSWMRDPSLDSNGSNKCSACRWFRYCRGGGMHLRNDDGRLLLCHLDRL